MTESKRGLACLIIAAPLYLVAIVWNISLMWVRFPEKTARLLWCEHTGEMVGIVGLSVVGLVFVYAATYFYTKDEKWQ